MTCAADGSASAASARSTASAAEQPSSAAAMTDSADAVSLLVFAFIIFSLKNVSGLPKQSRLRRNFQPTGISPIHQLSPPPSSDALSPFSSFPEIISEMLSELSSVSAAESPAEFRQAAYNKRHATERKTDKRILTAPFFMPSP